MADELVLLSKMVMRQKIVLAYVMVMVLQIVLVHAFLALYLAGKVMAIVMMVPGVLTL